MALFRNKLQILSMKSLKNHWRYNESLDKQPKSGSESNSRSLKYFWTSKQKPQDRLKNPCYMSPLDNPLITKGIPVRCSEVKKKKQKICKPQESFWSYLFGEQKCESPDPCARKLRYKGNCRGDGPKSSDSRYCTTTDVLLFTEHSKRLSVAPAEPQPKPPPIYKIPNSVTSSRIATAIGGHTCVHIPLPSKGDNCKKECLEPEPFWIPYTEMKPKERTRNPFTCESGKRTEDVVRPINRDKYHTGFPSFGNKNVEPDAEIPKKFSPCPSSSEDESFAKTCKGRKKLSRTERLKILTAGREGVYKPIK